MQSPKCEDWAKLPPIPWHEVCHQMLLRHPLRQHATNEEFELDLFVPLSVVKRKRQPVVDSMQRSSRFATQRVESRESIISRPSHLDRSVQVSLHCAPEYL